MLFTEAVIVFFLPLIAFFQFGVRPLDFRAEILQDLQHVVGVAHVGNPTDDALFTG